MVVLFLCIGLLVFYNWAMFRAFGVRVVSLPAFSTEIQKLVSAEDGRRLLHTANSANHLVLDEWVNLDLLSEPGRLYLDKSGRDCLHIAVLVVESHSS